MYSKLTALWFILCCSDRALSGVLEKVLCCAHAKSGKGLLLNDVIIPWLSSKMRSERGFLNLWVQ